ncbi:MAG TPA: CHASE3 domain-containing protein [Magnetospirillaceae bacterium]|jgi:PAS domain S-box-containing protein
MAKPIDPSSSVISDTASSSTMSQGPIRRVVATGIVVFALLIVAAGYAVLQEWHATVSARLWVDHSYQVIDDIRRVFDDMQDAESGARGFFITGDEAFLKAHDVALESIDGDLKQLHEAVQDNDVQLRQIELMKPLIAMKLAAVRSAIDRRREATGGAMPVVRDQTSAARGRVTMEEIRAISEAMIGEERSLLVVRNAERERSSRANLTIVMASFAIAAISVAVVLIMTFRYVQRRRESEAALAAQTVLMAATMEAVSQAIGVYDKDLRLVVWNKRYIEWSGIAPDMYVPGVTLPALLRRAADVGDFGDDQEKAKAWIAERMHVFDARVPYESERVRPDGTVLQIRGTFTKDGLSVTTFSDITDAKRAEQALMSNVARLNAIFDNTLDGIITINESGSIESFNPAAEAIFGHRTADILGRNVKILMPEPYRGAHDSYIRNYRLTGEKKVIGHRRELEGLRADGSTFPIELSINEFWSGGRRLFVGVVRDISERRQVERMKSEFISTVSHELRTPLTSIAGSLGLLAGAAAGELPDRAKRLVDIANKNSERLVRLVNDILDLDKIESGRMKFNFAPVALRPLLETCIEANRAYAANLNVRFVLDPASEDGTVSGDTDRLNQVFTNLLSNAAKFSPSGDQVDIRVELRSNMLRTLVIDHGPGIPDEFRSVIFQKFAQADSKDNRRKGGTGLGLSIARSIVEKHGGAVGFESQSGAGSTFYVDLPIWQEGVEAYNAATDDALSVSSGVFDPSPSGPLLRVLHVEDDEDVRRIVRLSLEGVATIAAAHSVTMARRRLASDAFDLVILDISLPDGSGLDLLPMKTQSGRLVPAIVFSGQEIEVQAGPEIKAVLIKSRASTAELMRHVRELAAQTRPSPETEPSV